MELKFNPKKFIEDLLSRLPANEPARVGIEYALKEQGMRFYNGAIEPILPPSLTENGTAKLKVGDWLVHKKLVGETFCITQINEPYYYITNLGSFIKFGEEDDYRPWTIEDAKPGDVLSDGTTIFIFKDLLSDGSVMSYCDYDTDSGESDAFCPLSMNLMCSKITPATKEQRDTLIKAIADAGYTFDFEKKELKKIEQKPTNNIEPIFNVGDKIQYLKGCGTIMTIEKIENGEYVFANNMGHTTIEDGNKWYLVEKKPAWSEEDVENKDVIDWLKFLKDGVQPDQEWSEEDDKHLERILKELENQCQRSLNRPYLDKIESDYNWLKSLKNRYTWKPSDEQMKQLGWIAEQNKDNIIGKELMTLYQDLKKLREE